MGTLFRWLLRGVLGLMALGALCVVGVYYFVARSVPEYDARLSVQGVTAPVEIVRNIHNVPHIFGQSDDDVFFGLGYAHAQDRLWQMTMMRRTVQGRLSEVFGPRTLRTDELMRRLDLNGLAVTSVAAQDAQTSSALEAYSRGVNAWINQVNLRARGRGAPEFFLFPGEVSLWSPADSIALVKLLALQLSAQAQDEVLRARTSLQVSEDRLRDILPDAPGDRDAALPEYGALFPNLPRDGAIPVQLAADPLSPLRAPAFAGASNSFAAAPDRAAAGGTLLANDPHMTLTAPSPWYLARVELTGGGVIGGSIPGIPLILSGRSAALGWGLTSSYMDDQDVFIEQLNPENPQEYRTPDGWAPFETRRSIIRVKESDPVTVTLRWTTNGPVLPGTHFDLATVTPPGHVASLSWTALNGADTTLSAGMAIMRSDNVDEAIVAAEGYVAPSQNLMLADAETIALQIIGHMPRRDVAHLTEGRMPSAGWLAENQWQGVFPYASNPRFTAPPSGLLGNTNNKILERPFPLHVSYRWGDTQRIQRWMRLMQTREVHTRDSFIEAQLDTVSQAARTLLPLVAADLWFSGEAAPTGTRAHLRQSALQLLADWNGEMNEHLPEPLIYAAWMRELQLRLIRDELGPLADAYTHIDPVFIERVFRDTDGAGAWCNVVQSSVTEGCTEIAQTALDAALLTLTEKYGSAVASWRWGDAHQATHDHTALGDVRALRYFVNIRQSTSGGDHTLMRGVTSGRDPEPFQNVHGAGYRGVYDFADPDSSVFITSTGQSGHPLSRHYDDLGNLWRRGEYIPMSLDPDLARAGAVGITTLLPPG
ncbi:penicillin acylase family protein [Roseicitreum antarcticum]|uniref:Penicillin amidase n=1 Tax=Roseicitreum antarcticum TaxID=564137 RepID=A0A1H3CFG2_9RHOB|nr:penicillin acylase family protein [Roseicitreum antarcticum]SDX52826.1 penicillin amidase [Roseicitreum antarcticum]